MVSGDVGSASFLNKQMKMRGLQKLRFYCQICQKQCRDENGFKSHSKSPSHLQKLSKVTHKDIEEYTVQFEKDFLRLLRLMHGEKKVEANKFYNEFIQDKDHVHMNATRFTSLARFIQHLSQEGKVRIHGIDELTSDTDPGRFMISYIDSSSANMIRKKQIESLKQAERSEQEIKLRLLEKQIEKANAEEVKPGQKEEEEEEEEETKTNIRDGPINLTVSTSKVTKKKPKKKLKNVFKPSK
ncbi:Rts2 [Kluyveromyces lactis]|nr:Rts2 [Kluyveromyces lactis]